jgi:3-hydroxyisobutyrate dehydrogenase-like beta-hydroxyacid dehydrogenase
MPSPTAPLNEVPAVIALLGYGEVGQIFAKALRACAGVREVCVWDRALAVTTPAEQARAQRMRAQAAEDALSMGISIVDALSSAQLVFCAVTADQALAAAREAAPVLAPGAWFVDLNSASPNTKIEASDAIQAAGARYVEAAVMASVPPYGIRVPTLLGGTHAQQAQPMLAAFGMAVEVADERLGIASAIKMCRSVIVKGIESLVVESFTAARHYGVEDRVIASLDETWPSMDWDKQANYLFSRVVQHGKRRADEMREAAVTMRETGIDGLMAAAIAERQAWMAQHKATGHVPPKAAQWRDTADALLAALAAAGSA